MINARSLSASEPAPEEAGPSFCLRKNVAAIQVLPGAVGEEPKLGMITQLPAGAELAACGAGFNERTIKVQWAGGMYFVFLQDLESPLSFEASI